MVDDKDENVNISINFGQKNIKLYKSLITMLS